MTPAMASYDLDGEHVIYLVFFGPPLLIGLWLAWIMGGWMTASSLSRYPQLVTTSPRIRALWRCAAWVPFLGPAAYGIALLVRHAMLGDDGWRAARARPAGETGFVPKRPQWVAPRASSDAHDPSPPQP